MIVARVLVGLIAAVISIAGIGWYVVYLFAPDPRKSATSGLPSASSPIKLHPTLARRQNKRSLILGSAAVIGVLALTPVALESIRTDVPVQILNEPPTNGWVLLAVIVFVGVLGAWVVASEILKMRKLWDDPGR
jgi:hypothetical protein